MTVITRVIALVCLGLALASAVTPTGARPSRLQPRESHYSAAFPLVRNGLWHGGALPIVPRRVIHPEQMRRT